MQYALINGDYPSFADITFATEGAVCPALKSINYGNKLGRAYVRGTNREALGMTSGQYEPTGDFEMYLPQLDSLLGFLGQAYGGVAFTITCSYAIAFGPTITDTLIGCRITDIEASQSEGIDALSRKVTVMYQRLLLNGKAMVLPLTGVGIAF